MSVNDLANLEQIRLYTKWMLESEEEGTVTLWPNDILDGYIAAEHRHVTNKIILANEGFFHRASTSNLVADQEYYELPADFRAITLLEYRASAGDNKWREIRPLDQPRRRKEYFSPEGIGIGQGSLTEIVHKYTGSDVRYHFSDNFIVLVPFINESMTAGLRIWYDYSPASPTGDSWIPYGDGTLSMLRDHHEILAVGAAIRGKQREELTHGFGDTYQTLWDGVIDATQKRQTQESKHGADLEGYY